MELKGKQHLNKKEVFLEGPINIIGVYAPHNYYDEIEKIEFYGTLRTFFPNPCLTPYILVGDWNTDPDRNRRIQFKQNH